MHILAIPLLLHLGEFDDIVLIHVFQEHLVDEAETHLAFQPLHMLIGFGPFGAIQLVGFIGVEPNSDCGMSGSESRTMFSLLVGRGPMAWLWKS